jgi:hypothetical protein
MAKKAMALLGHNEQFGQIASYIATHIIAESITNCSGDNHIELSVLSAKTSTIYVYRQASFSRRNVMLDLDSSRSNKVQVLDGVRDRPLLLYSSHLRHVALGFFCWSTNSFRMTFFFINL